MVSGPPSAGSAVTTSAKATNSVDNMQAGQQLQDRSIGDSIEILVDMDGCFCGHQFLVIGECSFLFKLESGKTVCKNDEHVAWRWVEEAEEPNNYNGLSLNSPNNILPIAEKLNRAISLRSDSETCTPDDDDMWRFVEDVLMKALLKHWGDGSFEPTQHGNISAKRDLENSLRGALAAELRSCKPNHKLSKQETSLLFSVWADALYSGVHDGKPMISLGEATMCLRNFTLSF